MYVQHQVNRCRVGYTASIPISAHPKLYIDWMYICKHKQFVVKQAQLNMQDSQLLPQLEHTQVIHVSKHIHVHKASQ